MLCPLPWGQGEFVYLLCGCNLLTLWSNVSIAGKSFCLCSLDHRTLEDTRVLQPLPGEDGLDGVCKGNSVSGIMSETQLFYHLYFHSNGSVNIFKVQIQPLTKKNPNNYLIKSPSPKSTIHLIVTLTLSWIILKKTIIKHAVDYQKRRLEAIL